MKFYKTTKITPYNISDSVIFTVKDGEWQPEESSFLGGWTNEVPPGKQIVEFLCGGPKSYGYQLNDGTRVIKCKGIVTKYDHFDNLRGFVDGTGPSCVNVERPFKIVRRKYELFSTTEVKRYRLVYTKRRVLADGINTRPFGYRE